MSEFQNVEIRELGTTITGKTPSSNSPEDFGYNYLFVTPSDSIDSKHIDRTERFLSKSGLDKLKNKVLPVNSILVSCIGSAMGKITMNRRICVTNQQFNSIIPHENYNSDYIYYCLKNNYKVLRNAAQGSTSLPLLNKSDFDNLKIVIHVDPKIQQRIASVLSSLDDKIELNNRINAELEAMAKTLYDYWFVQFDFPDANGKPYKSSGGKMVYNKELKRKIPEGWGVGKMADWIASDKSGDWGKEQEEGNYTLKVSCIRGADINGLNGKGDLNPPERYILEKNNSKILNPYDLIVEISGGSPTQSTGRMAYITKELLNRFENPLICSNFCKAISLKNEKFIYNFAFLWNMLYDNKVFFGYEGKTSGIKNFLFDSFVNSYWSVIPKEDIVLKFFAIMQETEKKKQMLLPENQRLASLRDWLLPMLMNGQVGFKEAYQEQVVNVAAETAVEYKSKAKADNFQVDIKEEKKDVPMTNSLQQQDQRFELWLSSQGLAARGEIDKATLREIFNVMDEEEYGK